MAGFSVSFLFFFGPSNSNSSLASRGNCIRLLIPVKFLRSSLAMSIEFDDWIGAICIRPSVARKASLAFDLIMFE